MDACAEQAVAAARQCFVKPLDIHLVEIYLMKNIFTAV